MTDHGVSTKYCPFIGYIDHEEHGMPSPRPHRTIIDSVVLKYEVYVASNDKQYVASRYIPVDYLHCSPLQQMICGACLHLNVRNVYFPSKTLRGRLVPPLCGVLWSLNRHDRCMILSRPPTASSPSSTHGIACIVDPRLRLHKWNVLSGHSVGLRHLRPAL